MSENNNCVHRSYWLLGCKFELFGCKFKARYESLPVPPEHLQLVVNNMSNGSLTIEEVRTIAGNRYICDVCVRCGQRAAAS